jgi:hypothetical protein
MYSYENDRRAGYRPGVGLLLICGGQLMLVQKASELSIFERGTDGELKLVDTPPEKWMFEWDIPQEGVEPGESLLQTVHYGIEEELGGHLRIGSVDFIGSASLDRDFTRDGIRWRGKRIYYHAIEVLETPDGYDDYVYGSRGDECSPFPIGGEYAGGLFLGYATASRLIRSTRRGPKVETLLNVIEGLRADRYIH